MQLKYFFAFLLLPSFSSKLFAQENIPNLGQTYPWGGAGAMTTPTEIDASNGVNSITTYIPIVPITDAGMLVFGCNPANVKRQIVYTDGTNTPFQSINLCVSKVGVQYKNLVQVADNTPKREQYGFLPFTTHSNVLVPDAYQQQSDYYGNLYGTEGYTSFSKAINSSDNNTRSLTSYSPGKSMVGQNRGTVTKTISNLANQVRIWDVDANGLPVAAGFYAANELFGEETVLPSGNTGGNNYTSAQTRIYKDKEGKVILKMVADDNYHTGSSTIITYQSTYYVYDTKGNLVVTITPKAYQYYEQNNSLPLPVVNNLCFLNRYDAKGRLVAAQKPGEVGYTQIVYDRKNRTVMRQTPNEAGAGEWAITYYNALGAIKATSIFSSAASQTAMQSQLDSWTGGGANDLMYYLATDEGELLAPAESSIAGNTMMSYAYYDNYEQADPAGDAWNTYATNGLQSNELVNTNGNEIPSRSLRTQGMPTGSLVRILASGNIPASHTGEWRRTTIFYDDKGRVIYSVAMDLMNDATPIHEHYNSNQYDFAGRVQISKHVMVNANGEGGNTTHTEFTKSQYETGTGNLLKTWHKVDGQAWAILATYKYDDMGRVKTKSLADGGEVQDFTYNIRGQLTGINGEYAETGYKNGVSKTFGESLKYDFGFTKNRYDGKIAGMVWRGSSQQDMYAYGYDYTQNQSLKKADFNTYQMSGTSWNHTAIDYSVSNLAYDKNGNIQHMDQRGMDPNNPGAPQDIDVLAYSYDNGNGPTNQLTLVEDQGVEVAGGNDFRNSPPGSTGSGYAYDNNGNLVADYNKGIALTYTRFNKPLMVNFVAGNNKFTEYAYDAAGNKLAELVKDDDNGIEKLTEYIGNFIYENNVLKYILTSEGRTVFDDQSATPIREEYFVKDHLGNVRSVINAYTSNISEYLATYELASANLENMVFDNLDEIREYKPGADQGDFMAANLDAADPKKRIGSSLLVHVMAGDKVSMNVNNFYENYNHNDESTLDGGDVLGSLLSTLTGGAGGFGGGENHNTQLVGQLFNGENFAAVNDIVSSQNTDASKPKSYLNYVLFNERMEVVHEMSGAFQANGDGDWAQIGTQTAMEVPQNGYLAVYLSNASVRASTQEGYRVFYDRLTFTVTKGNLLEETHYYPFGLPIKTLSSTETPAEFKENRHKYQGNEFIIDLGLNWMDFNNRTYDPQLGRFLQVDPLAAANGQDMFSPYAAMGNMPEVLVDPQGLTPGFNMNVDVAQAVGGGSGGASYAGDVTNLSMGSGDNYNGFSRGGGGTDGFAEIVNRGTSERNRIAFMEAAMGYTGNENVFVNFEEDSGGFFDGEEAGGNATQGGSSGGNPDPQEQKTEEDKEVYFKSNPPSTTLKQPPSLCGPMTMENASKEVSGNRISTLDVSQYMMINEKINVNIMGMSGAEMERAAKYYFKTGKFTTYQDAINKGQPVITWYPAGDGQSNHFVLVIGYTTISNQLIYLNTLTGNADRQPISNFLQRIAIPIIRNR